MLFTMIAFDKRTTSARELMRQVQSDRILKANPKMKINVNVVGTADPPVVQFEFVDGDKVSYCRNMFHILFFVINFCNGVRVN